MSDTREIHLNGDIQVSQDGRWADARHLQQGWRQDCSGGENDLSFAADVQPGSVMGRGKLSELTGFSRVHAHVAHLDTLGSLEISERRHNHARDASRPDQDAGDGLSGGQVQIRPVQDTV